MCLTTSLPGTKRGWRQSTHGRVPASKGATNGCGPRGRQQNAVYDSSAHTTIRCSRISIYGCLMALSGLLVWAGQREVDRREQDHRIGEPSDRGGMPPLGGRIPTRQTRAAFDSSKRLFLIRILQFMVLPLRPSWQLNRTVPSRPFLSHHMFATFMWAIAKTSKKAHR